MQSIHFGMLTFGQLCFTIKNQCFQQIVGILSDEDHQGLNGIALVQLYLNMYQTFLHVMESKYRSSKIRNITIQTHLQCDFVSYFRMDSIDFPLKWAFVKPYKTKNILYIVHKVKTDRIRLFLKKFFYKISQNLPLLRAL